MKSELIKKHHFTLGIYLLLCIPAFAAEDQFLILNAPIKITAREIDEPDKIPGHFHLEIAVAYGGDQFKFQTLIFLQDSNLKEAIEYQKERTQWKNPYLLVGWERGGGNASRGYLVAVFKMIRGRLQYIGEADAMALEKAVFVDVYNKFELNRLTSHSGSPGIVLVLEEKAGQFVSDLKRTWTENQKRFIENSEIIKSIQSKENRKTGSGALQIVEPLLFNAVLIKYCKHNKDINDSIETAKNELDNERLKLFHDILAQVIPGELPEAAIQLKRY